MKKLIMGMFVLMLMSVTTSVSFASDGPKTAKESVNENVIVSDLSGEIAYVLTSVDEVFIGEDYAMASKPDNLFNYIADKDVIKLVDENNKDNKIRFVDRYFILGNKNNTSETNLNSAYKSKLPDTKSCFYRYSKC